MSSTRTWQSVVDLFDKRKKMSQAFLLGSNRSVQLAVPYAEMTRTINPLKINQFQNIAKVACGESHSLILLCKF